MNTEDLRQLAARADHVEGRSTDRLAEVHGRIRVARRVRAAVTGSVVVAVAAAVVVGGTALGGQTDRTQEPIEKPRPDPTPTLTERTERTIHPAEGTRRLSPRQTVLSYNANLVTALASFDDPDVRVSVWDTECLVCPPMSYSRQQPRFLAMAVTEDGFRTATYLRVHMAILDSISSVSRDTFLLNDQSNGVLRLLRADGTLRLVRMLDETRTPDDPRTVVPCGGFEEGLGNGWCVLDVATATAARLPATYVGNGMSAANPALHQRPWGLEALPNLATTAWWDDGGVRRYGDLPTAGIMQTVPSLAEGDDQPTYLNWPLWSDRLDLYVVKERGGGVAKVGSRPWLPVTRQDTAEVGHPKEVALYPEFSGTPDGGLLAWSTQELTERPGLTIWRADDLARGEFETVYESQAHTWFTPRPTLHDGRIYLGTLVSDDDGRTWTEPVTTWR